MEINGRKLPPLGAEITGYVINVSYNQVVMETDDDITAYLPFSDLGEERTGIYQGEEIKGFVKYADPEIASVIIGLEEGEIPALTQYDVYGDFYHAAVRYEKAMDCYKKALGKKEEALKTAADEEETNKIRGEIALSHKNIAELYADMKELPAAVESYKKGFEILQELPPSEELILFAARIGDICEDMEDYESAIDYTYEACQYEADRGAAMMNMGQMPDTSQSEAMANYLLKLAELYGKLGDTESQIQAYGNALTFFSSVVEERGTVRDFYVLAEINYRIGDLTGDISCLEQAVDTLESMALEYQDLEEIKTALERAEKRLEELENA